MKQGIRYIVLLSIWMQGLGGQSAPTPHVISFFMVPCASNPTCSKKFPTEKLPEMLTPHTQLSEMVLTRHLASPLVRGIYVNYLGYLTYTDYNGQVILPNKEAGTSLTVVVTSQIYPVIFQGNTVHHFEVPQEVDAAFYRYNLTHDEKHNKWYWHITSLERPANSQLDIHALTIMAKPKDIEIMPGTYAAIPGPHLILPDVFVHTSIDNPFCVLKFLKVNRFFEALVVETKYETQSFSQALTL